MTPGSDTAAPRLGWYGDDFTGASDTLSALARRGQRALLFLQVPSRERYAAEIARTGPLDAVGIAGAARALAPQEMAAELEPVGAFFAGLGVRVMHYKCCSTFDSAPHRGSIGAAAQVLRRHFPHPFLPIVGGQPEIGRHCLFSTLFAAAGTGGETFRIDRHPTMRAHPVTPMDEADLRLHLARQGLARVSGLHYPRYDAPPAALDRVLEQMLQSGPDAVLCDVARAADLETIGRLIWQAAQRAPLLAIGASSLAQALCAHWGAAEAPAAPLAPAQGPVFLMAGSLSPITRRQMEAAGSYLRVPLDAGRLVDDPAYGARVLESIGNLLSAGRSVMAWTAPADGHAADTRRAAAVAAATAQFVARVTRRAPMRRLGIAGGDTSSHAVRAMGFRALSFLAAPSPGVALCRAHGDMAATDGMEIMLKGGQMGSDDLFERLVHGG